MKLLVKEQDAPWRPIRVECADTLAAVRPWADDWRLLDRGASASQLPAYIEAAWLSGLCSGDLRVLMAFDGDRLVAAWPLYASRSKGAVILRHIGNGGREEYAGPVIAQDEAPEPILHALMEKANSLSADLVEIYNLEDGSAAHQFFLQAPARQRSAGQIRCLSVATGSQAWSTWFGARTKKFRNDLKYTRKKLGADGAIEFAQVTAADSALHAEWCIQTKRRWLDAHKIQESWLRHPNIVSFYASLMGRGLGVEGFALKVGGKTIAGCLVLIDASRAEFYLTAYDVDYARVAPGKLLIEDVAAWCADRGLDFDFRFPVMGYKTHWADQSRIVHTVALALTSRGASVLRGRKLIAAQRRLLSAIKKAFRLAIRRDH